MTTTSKANHYDQAIRRLADGFSSEFAEFCAADERMHELMMELASEYVDTCIPIVSEDDQTEVASELMLRVTVTNV